MNKNRRTWVSIALVLTMLVLLASCTSPAPASGGGSDSPAGAAQPDAPTASGGDTQPEAPAEAEKVPVNMSVFSDQSGVGSELWDTYLTMVAERFPDYEMNFEKVPSTSPEEFIKSKIAGGDFPDLMWVFQPALLIDGGVIQELPGELENMLLTPNEFKVKGKLYTMPMHMGVLGIWYNKDIFRDAGVTELPKTWDEYLAACEKIQAYGVEPIGMAAKDGWYIAGNFNFLWAPATYGAEPDWPKLRSEGSVKFNNPTTMRSLEQFAQTIPYWQRGALSAGYDEVKALFFGGQIAMLVNGGSYNIPEVDNGDVTPDFDVGYLMPPQDTAEMRRANSFQDNLWVINSEASGAKFDACVNLIKLYFDPAFYPTALTSNCNLPSVKGFETNGPEIKDPRALVMLEEIMAAVAECGTVPHAHAAQGENMWPAGCREMSEKVVQEVAAGNSDFNALMNLFDDQWDKGLEQAEQQ